MVEKILFEETKKLLIYEEQQADKSTYYRQHKEDEKKELVKIYEITDKKIIYQYEGNSVKEIIFDGFKELPEIVSRFGYGFENKTINNFFRNKFKENIKTIIISNKPSKEEKGIITVNLKALKKLTSSINQEQYACNITKDILVTNFLSENFPSLSFEHKETNNNKKQVLRNLNSKLMQQLNANEIEKIGKFYVEASQKYNRPDIVKRMLLDLQKNTQLITLQEIIKQYEDLLEKNPSEKIWQEFFNEYITLFDNRYIKKLNYNNIATGITKYPDMVLVDIYGYVDFYELKKSNTPILQYDKSHKTFFWSKDISMAIAQVSDYLQKAKENSQSYSKTIKNETATENEDGVEVNSTLR